MTLDAAGKGPARHLHRRLHVKPDGRKLFLYGWHEHDLPAGAELEPVPPPNPQLRWHPLRREWVAYAAHRQDRTFKPPAEYCPLCPAREDGHPGEVPFADFEIAVFENRFPGFHRDADSAPELPVPSAPAQGTCEVVVFSSAHQGNLASLGPDRLELLVRVWIERYRDLLAEPHIRFVMPFENRGEEVGVTLHHPHGQIYAFPYVPPVLEQEVAAFRERPVLVELLERMGTVYDVSGDSNVAAFVPPFARFPYEVWVAPRAFHPGPWTFGDAEIRSFARTLGDIVARFDGLFNRPFPYVLALHAAPKGEEKTFHFHAEFYPLLRSAERLKYIAGCEQAAGTFLVDSLPETTAARLREVTP